MRVQCRPGQKRGFDVRAALHGLVHGTAPGNIQKLGAFGFVQIAGQDAEVTYAGAAPSLVAGVLQVNCRIPAGVPSGDIPIVLISGHAHSGAGVTVSVQ